MPKHLQKKSIFFTEEDKKRIENKITFLSKIYRQTDLTEEELTKAIKACLNGSAELKKDMRLMSAQFFSLHLSPEKHWQKIEQEFCLGHLKTRAQKNLAYDFIKNKTEETLTSLKQTLKENPTQKNIFLNFTNL